MTNKQMLQKQQIFFSRLKNIVPSNISFVEIIAEILDLSIDSVYRRIRGETALTFEEAIKLCENFHISIDALVDFSYDTVTFNYSPINQDINTFKNFLKNILDDIIFVSKIELKKVIYIADDIPLFHLFQFDELSAFKVYYWLKSVINIPEYQNKKFSIQYLDEEILKIGKKLNEEYNKLNSIEIWTENTINSIRKQIEYYYEAGLFEKDKEAFLLLDQLEALIRDITHKAERNSKLPDKNQTNFSVYFSEVEIGNNCIYASANDFKKVYLTFNTFNTMSTINQKFCDEVYTWINCIISKSNLISGISEKQRLIFIHRTIDKIEETRRKLSKLY